MALRPLDRLPSIRAKLGSVIVFAVAVTILIMYLAVGFALRGQQHAKQLETLSDEARGIVVFGFNENGAPTRALLRAVGEQDSPVLLIGIDRQRLFGTLPVPPTVNKALSGYPDRGTEGKYEYFGVPVVRQGFVIGAIYLSRPITGRGVLGALGETFSLLAKFWWQLLLAGAVAALIALFLARILARGLTQPLRDMAQASQRMATGDYGQRVDSRGSRDEVGQLAQAFNRMAGQMETLERLRRELVANVSHELKTPISALRAHLENLLDGVEEPNPVVLSVMLQQSERLSRLVEQLLELSRLESGDVPLDLEPVPLGLLVDRVVAEIQVARPERMVQVRNEVPSGLAPIRADRERIHQVLFNLLDNAVRFTPQGGIVRVRAAGTEEGCLVEVEDTGPGIPPEHLGLVFERFYRVDASRSRGDGGTGIGLAIARSVVEAHGGRIWVDSEPGHGATFRFVLPFDGPAGSTSEPRPAAREAVVGPAQEVNEVRQEPRRPVDAPAGSRSGS
jgi:signal transduction histidine kinase